MVLMTTLWPLKLLSQRQSHQQDSTSVGILKCTRVKPHLKTGADLVLGISSLFYENISHSMWWY